MTDPAPTDLTLPADAQGAAYNAWAYLGDGSPVAIARTGPTAAPLRWWVQDGRTTDGWREVTDKDAIGQLVADINAAQAEAGRPVSSGPGAGPELVKADDGSTLIGTGLASETVAEPEADQVTAPDETPPDDESED